MAVGPGNAASLPICPFLNLLSKVVAVLTVSGEVVDEAPDEFQQWKVQPSVVSHLVSVLYHAAGDAGFPHFLSKVSWQR